MRTSAVEASSSATAVSVVIGDRAAAACCLGCHGEYTSFRYFDRLSPCPTCHPARVESPQHEKRGGYAGDILDDLERSGVNVHKYQGATLDAFDATHDSHALQAARRWIRAWRERRAERFPARDWMYFYGTGSARSGRQVKIGQTGNGKTFLAIAIARHLIEAGQLSPERLRFVTAEQILLESEATFRAGSEDSEMQLLRRYQRPDLLIVDDLGVRLDWSPHAVRIFDELTKRREAKATIWTSNLSLPVLAGGAEFMRRIVDRIAGELGDGAPYRVEFRGPSRRIERTKAAALEVVS